MSNYITRLSDLSYKLGIIELAEYEERLAVAEWLLQPNGQGPDPRAPSEDPRAQEEPRESRNDIRDSGSSSRVDQIAGEAGEEDGLPRFLALGTWVFTLGDPDCYPSVPHGHHLRKTTPWPKLNPYVGRVFVDVHREDVRRRLTRLEMKQLWKDDEFVAHCREQVVWYSDFAPRYAFPLARRGRMMFPRW